jgi:hypothetical protein
MDAIFGDIPILSIDLPYAGLRRAGSFPDKLRGREIQPVCACTKPKSARYTEYMYVYTEKLPDKVLKAELLLSSVDIRQLACSRRNTKIKLWVY